MSLRSSRTAVALSLAIGACLIFRSASASAQTIDINPAYPGNPPSLPRIGADGKQVQKRSTNLNPEGVSLQDCVDDQRIRFPLTLSPGFQGSASLQAWASISGDCTQQTSRSSGTQVCWPLVTGIPLSTNPSVDIPVRAIMSGVLSATSPNATESVCGTVDLATVSVQFLYFNPGDIATAATSKTFTIMVDTIGPPPPTGLRHLPGNTRIHVYWDAIGEGGVVAMTGVKVYCDELQTSPDDAGTDADADADDAGTDADADANDADAEGGTDNANCPPNAKPFGGADMGSILPDNKFDSQYLCGSIAGNTGSSVIASGIGANSKEQSQNPLVNGVTYAVAVAATDDFNNVGPLSTVQCETPQSTTDFWETYKDAGGGAGGGYCAVGGVGLPMGSVTVLGVATMFAFYMIRRGSSRTRNGR